MNAHDELVRTLMPEFFQTERSASRHTRVEAGRLGDTPPAEALYAVARHADRAIEGLAELGAALHLPGRMAGQAVGTTFSLLRGGVGDRLLDPERSYRGTLLGIHHGLDLVRLLAATSAYLPALAPLTTFCEAWLHTRTRLAEVCTAELAWFAANPEVATRAFGVAPLDRLRHRFDALMVVGMRRGLGLGRA